MYNFSMRPRAAHLWIAAKSAYDVRTASES